MTGFYLMHRGWQDHPVFRNAEYSVRDAFEWLIASAVFQDCTTVINGKVVKLKRGQLSFSIRFLANKWKWDKARVTRYVSMLSRCKMIDTETDTGQLIITICNYETYQAPQDATETATDTPARQQRDSSETKKNNANNDNKDSEAYASDASASAEPEILPPVEMELPDFLNRNRPPDPKTAIFNEGLAWLSKKTGKPPDKLRPLLGKFLAEHGDAKTAAALVDAQQNSAVEPISWMRRFLGDKRDSGSGGLSAALLGEGARRGELVGT